MKFTYLDTQHTDQYDIYEIRIRYNDDTTRVFSVKVNNGSVSIIDDDKRRMQLIELLKKEGFIEKEIAETEINLGTLIIQNDKLEISRKAQTVIGEAYRGSKEADVIFFRKFIK